jgi:putative two-component system response regulator
MVTAAHRINVLVVCGDVAVRERLKEGLLTHNCEVLTASDGETAFLLLKQKRVDALVTSIELLGMNGLQLCRGVTRVYPHMPVVMMSQNPEASQVTQALSSGACDLVGESSCADEAYAVIQRNMERREFLTRRILSDRSEVLGKAIRVIIAAIDAKSLHASRHSGRVTQISLMIGERVPLSAQQMAVLELSAQLHDVGKIGTPDAVLSKPDTLTDEEWVDVLKHPALSGSFLAAVPELAEVATIARHHHEHVDGTGYPDGLQGEAIPLLSRILAAADAYEAMTSERPYRNAMSHEQALSEMRTHCGTQFDTIIVDHLIAALSDAASERKAA